MKEKLKKIVSPIIKLNTLKTLRIMGVLQVIACALLILDGGDEISPLKIISIILAGIGLLAMFIVWKMAKKNSADTSEAETKKAVRKINNQLNKSF